MTAPGDGTAAGRGGHLRASHTDRDRVIDGLKAAFVQGRLDQDELGHRVGQALASRTYAELAALTADLPTGLVADRLPRPARKRVNRPGVAVTAGGTVAAAGFLVAQRFIPDSTPFAIALPFIVIMLTLTSAAPIGWLLIFHAWLENRASSQAASGLPPGAGGPAPRRAAQAGPARQLPRTDRDPGITAEAAPRPSGRVRPRIVTAH
jgi:Domain of unknown function (DUF1707)